MQNFLFIFNDAPYGSERTFNGLRLAANILEQHEDAKVNIFLMSDSVAAALPRQDPAEGYNVQQLVEILLEQGSTVKLCKTCTDARGITELPLIEGAKIATLIELSAWTMQADKVITF